MSAWNTNLGASLVAAVGVWEAAGDWMWGLMCGYFLFIFLTSITSLGEEIQDLRRPR